MTALGPAFASVTFRADCTFTMRLELLFFRLRERGQYRVAANRIEFHRESGETHWPYRFNGKRLLLTEYVNEVHAYSRAR